MVLCIYEYECVHSINWHSTYNCFLHNSAIYVLFLTFRFIARTKEKQTKSKALNIVHDSVVHELKPLYKILYFSLERVVQYLKKYRWVWTFVFHRYNSCTQITICKYFLGDLSNCLPVSFSCFSFLRSNFLVPFFVFRFLLDPIYVLSSLLLNKFKQSAWVFTLHTILSKL